MLSFSVKEVTSRRLKEVHVRHSNFLFWFTTFTVAALAGCGSGSSTTGGSGTGSSGGGGAQTSNPTTVTYTFTGGTPTATAVQIGTGAFTAATLQSNKLSITIPSGTTTYAIAYVCPPVAEYGETITFESVIEASTQDGSSFPASCFGSGTTGSVTGTVDASAIPGATSVVVRGNQAYGTTLRTTTGSFNASLLTGTNDVALIALNSSGTVLAVKILRGQTVPGALNGGNSIVFSTTDETTPQSITVNGVPSGYVTPATANVLYVTAGGTIFYLSTNATTQYLAVPSAAVAAGDFYSFEPNSDDVSTDTAFVGANVDSPSGGSVTLALPAAWSYAGPTAALLPTFNFSYSGFSSDAAITYESELEWQTSQANFDTVSVAATGNYLGSSTSVAVPNLSALTGFVAPAPAGTFVTWVAYIWGGGWTPDLWDGGAQGFPSYTSPPSSGSISFVKKIGNFTQP